MTKEDFIDRINRNTRVSEQDIQDMWDMFCGVKYNYEEAVKDDVIEYIADEINFQDWNSREELEEELNDRLWTVDSVTGNGSGSYTFNSWRAEFYLCHNLDLLGEALTEFCCEPDYLVKHGAEACDVTIRCYLLNRSISAALDYYEETVENLWHDQFEDDEETDE